jgi:hypothetical protein
MPADDTGGIIMSTKPPIPWSEDLAQNYEELHYYGVVSKPEGHKPYVGTSFANYYLL